MDKFLLHIPFGAYSPHTKDRSKTHLHTLLIQELSLFAEYIFTAKKCMRMKEIYLIYYMCTCIYTYSLICVHVMGGGVMGRREISRYNIFLDG